MGSQAKQYIVSVIGSIFVPVFSFLYGDREVVQYLMTALVFFVMMDWISGVRASKVDESYSSHYGIDGVFRSFFILLLPAGGNLLDNIFGTNGILFGLLGTGVLYHTIQSMTANAIRAGWGAWFPEWILTTITNWVREEIEAKMARSKERRKELQEKQDDDKKIS